MTATIAARPRQRRHIPISVVLLPILFFGVFLAAWQIYVRIAEVPVLLLPAPSDIARQFVDDFSLLVDLARNTAREAITGTVIGTVIAIVVAAVVRPVKWIHQGFLSYSAAVKALPVVALYPIMTVFFGVTSKAVIAMVAFSVGPIMYTFAARGFSGTSQQDELMRSIAAPQLMRFRSLVLPRSLPYLMTGLRTVAPLSVIIAIISEYFGGSVTTLGTYIRRESKNLHTVTMWSAIVMACVLGIAAFVTVTLLDRFVNRWHPKAAH